MPVTIPVTMPKHLPTLAATTFLGLAAFAGQSAALAKDGRGTFTPHKAYQVTGTASVSGHTLELTDFKTSSGPDLFVYVGNGRPTKRVARLKANSGAQSYTLPKGEWSTVHIHCRLFSSTFATARLD